MLSETKLIITDNGSDRRWMRHLLPGTDQATATVGMRSSETEKKKKVTDSKRRAAKGKLPIV